MNEQTEWQTWKLRWKSTEENAVDIVKEIFRLGGTQLVDKRNIEKHVILEDLEDGLAFATELGWLKPNLTGSYKVIASGLLMLSHRIKD